MVRPKITAPLHSALLSYQSITVKHIPLKSQRMTEKMAVDLQILFVFLCLASGKVTANFVTSAPNIQPELMEFQGNGSISATEILLTLGEPGSQSLVYWKAPQDVQFGFKAAVHYISTECDTIPSYLGGDGFAFFFSPVIDTLEPLSGGGTLGLANKKNIALVGFDMITENIVYRAATVNIIGPRPGYSTTRAIVSTLKCNPAGVDIQLKYTPPVFRITSNSTGLDVSIALDLRDYFDPYAQLYVGLSAATGEAFMRQAFTYWEYTGVAPPSSVTPFLECFEPTTDKTQYIAHMGYTNPSPGTISYEIGASNGFTPAPQDRGQPTSFPSGRSPYYPLSAFTFQWDGSTVTWNVSNNVVTFNADNTALLCPQSLNVIIVFETSYNLTEYQISNILESIANFLSISVTRVTFVGVNYIPIGKRSVMQDQQATLELEIGQVTPDTQDEPSASQTVQKFVESASNSTLINEVLNPPTSNATINFVSLKATGVEGTGNLVVAPPTTVVVPPVTSPSASPIESPITTPPTTVPFGSKASSATAMAQSVLIVTFAMISVLF